MIVLVCGGRNYNNTQAIEDRLRQLPPDACIIEGGCQGADFRAREVALRLGLDVIEVPANWTRYGKAAGPRRNDRMLSMGPDLVIGFHENIAESKGTAYTVNKARRLGIPVEVIG